MFILHFLQDAQRSVFPTPKKSKTSKNMRLVNRISKWLIWMCRCGHTKWKPSNCEFSLIEIGHFISIMNSCVQAAIQEFDQGAHDSGESMAECLARKFIWKKRSFFRVQLEPCNVVIEVKMDLHISSFQVRRDSTVPRVGMDATQAASQADATSNAGESPGIPATQPSPLENESQEEPDPLESLGACMTTRVNQRDLRSSKGRGRGRGRGKKAKEPLDEEIPNAQAEQSQHVPEPDEELPNTQAEQPQPIPEPEVQSIPNGKGRKKQEGKVPKARAKPKAKAKQQQVAGGSVGEEVAQPKAKAKARAKAKSAAGAGKKRGQKDLATNTKPGGVGDNTLGEEPEPKKRNRKQVKCNPMPVPEEKREPLKKFLTICYSKFFGATVEFLPWV